MTDRLKASINFSIPWLFLFGYVIGFPAYALMATVVADVAGVAQARAEMIGGWVGLAAAILAAVAMGRKKANAEKEAGQPLANHTLLATGNVAALAVLVIPGGLMIFNPEYGHLWWLVLFVLPLSAACWFSSFASVKRKRA